MSVLPKNVNNLTEHFIHDWAFNMVGNHDLIACHASLKYRQSETFQK